ncbi:MAG: trypsin-like serine protease [Pirellulales bacterium]|nr:trypsin-like serine protease [Pirellulales bacterium]
MSLFRMPALRSIASKVEGLRDRLGLGRPGRGVTERAFRRLLVDPLEQRQLLSLSPADVQQWLVNETLGANITTGAQCIGVDNDGDFVVAWTRYDTPTDGNIYARYFTDEVQRITLPAGVLTDNLPDTSLAHFSLGYNGNEVQKLTLSAAYAPATLYGGFQPLIVGQFRLGLDLNGNGVVDGNEAVTVSFDESAPLTQTAADMQTGLRGLGGVMQDVVVKAISPHEFEIYFGDATLGDDMPQIETVAGFTTFTSGFLPAVTLSTIRQPGTVVDIPISPDNPADTALAIEQWFDLTASSYSYAPVFFTSPETTPPMGPYLGPETTTKASPEVSVRAVSATEFDVTFVGISSKINHPEMKVIEVRDEAGNALSGASVKTIKETSPEFRVNDAEPDNPFTPGVDALMQNAAAVAMDADGDFVITWQSEMAELPGQEGRMTDIYARRFSPVGYVDPANVEFVQGVRALGNQFQVNSFTANAQVTPDIGMDAEGNFVIAWANVGQDQSFFNNIRAQRFNRDGDRVGNEWTVNDDLTTSYSNPFVAMSDDGHIAISWTLANPIPQAHAEIWVDIFTPDGVSMMDGPAYTGMVAGDSSLAFDSFNNLLIVGDGTADTDLGGALNSSGISMMMVELYNRGGEFIPENVSLAIMRPITRINSAIVWGNRNPDWPHDQISGKANLDTDGDIYITYDGYGPDVAENEVDLQLETLLIAQYGMMSDVELGAYRASQEQLLLLDLIRGDATGEMLTYYDTDPYGFTDHNYSDSFLNSQRDGHNHKLIITIDRQIDGGNFVLRLSRAGVDGFEDRSFAIPTSGDPARINPGDTVDALDDFFESYLRTGTTDFWPEDDFSGSITVRLVNDMELAQRMGTPWDLFADPTHWVFEITFLGESHDWPFTVGVAPNGGHMTMGDINNLSPTVYDYQLGDPGTMQTFGSSGVEPDGDLTSVFTQFERFTDLSDYMINPSAPTNVYYRRLEENTDTAGPNVTDFLVAGGNRVTDGGQVIDAMSYIVVTFDEELTTLGVGNVTNVANWSLLKDGVQLSGGIRDIQFGMNMSTTLGLNSAGSNKWEAVIFFDGNGASAGTPALGGGSYQIIAKNSLKDLFGNPLGRTGYNIQGASISRSFYLVPPTGTETPVNTQTAGDQGAMEETTDPDLTPNSPRSIAGDADGEYVVVWTDTGSSPGIWAKVCRTEWTKVGNNRVSNTVTVSEFRVTTDATATYAAVARDGDGDFVVTWSQYDATTGWDVWYRRYDAQGRALDVARMANVETEAAQRFSTVAVDNDGDFVIAWQSDGQDDSGYGIYAQRFNRAGERLGGVNEVQAVRLASDVIPATFTLDLDGQITGPITFTGDLANTADEIEAAFAALGIEVQAEVVNEQDIAIEFLGEHGLRDVPPLVLNSATVGGDTPIELFTLTEGVSSEFRVNDTTVGNQVFASSAMDAQGNFVISWTSFGQGGDAANESNVYAKKLVSNEVFLGDDMRQGRTNGVVGAEVNSESIDAQRIITSGNDPDTLIAPAGTGLDGVVMITNMSAGTMGSGSLLLSGRHILTAAHVVSDFLGNPDLASSFVVTFDLPGGPVNIPASEVYVHPDYDGDIWNGSDVAIIVLSEEAPDLAERYDIYRDTDEIGEVFHQVGFGATGTGALGEIDALGSGVRREGHNRYEAIGTLLGIDDGILVYDFDSSSPTTDALGTNFGIVDLGLGTNIETNSAHGDSGGPGFINGLIAGVCSGAPHPFHYYNTDVTPFVIDSSFGEISIDARVSTYASWIDAVVDGSSPEFLVNTTIDGDQKWSSVAMDADGDFVITWTSYGHDGVGSGYGAGYGGEYGVFAQRFNSSSGIVGGEFQVNTYTDDNQQHSQVAMDADGDFVITWESFQERPGGAGAATSYGIYAQRYSANNGPNDGRIGGEFHVNTTTAGDQRFPSVMLSHTGDAVFAWFGPGVGDTQGVFTQRYEVLADVAGPVVTDVQNVVSGSLAPVFEGEVVSEAVTKLVVRFGENLSTAYGTSGADSILNPNNWQLTNYGTTISKGVRSITFGLNQAYNEGLASAVSGKYEAVLTLDGDPTLTGAQPLGDGSYVLTVSGAVKDLFGNQLDGDFSGRPGGDFSYAFLVQTTPTTPNGDIPVVGPTTTNARTYAETPNAIAADADGDHVIVWTAFDEVLERDRVYGRRFDANGAAKGDAFEITPAALAGFGLDDQRHASVAMDADGDFIVTWTNYRDTNGDNVNDEADIYARRYTADGTAQGSPFRVNTYTTNAQKWSDVAMDLDGDFVITWSSMGQEDNQQLGYGYGVYARRFDSYGMSLGTEFQVNVTKVGNQQFPSIAMDATGDFIIAWTSDQAIDGDDIIARAFKANGSPMPIDNSLSLAGQPIGIHGGEILVNTTTAGDQRYADVAVDMTGTRFVVAWTSSAEDGSGYGVYARRLTLDPTIGYVQPDATNPINFRVNTSTNWNQMYPSVAMSWNGSYIVTWSGYGNRPTEPDTSGYGVFYQRYNALGELIGTESRANAETQGNQWLSSVAVDANGNFFLAWTGVGNTADATDVYRYVGKTRFLAPDGAGPVVTDVLSASDRSRMIQDATIETVAGVQQLVLVFSENLSTTGGTTGLDSVLNPSNWLLERNGSELALGVNKIEFQYNTATRKYEAIVTFDSNGLTPGTPALVKGDYTLTLRDAVTDGANRLDGDLDAVPGTTPAAPALQGYSFHFSVADTPNLGPEYRVNASTAAEQTASPTLGMGMGLEYTNRCVAVDHDGDFVVVWTSIGLDDPSDANGAGVYMRMFDRNNNPLTGDILVNTYTVGHQRNAEVAMDADGDFVVVWESQGQDTGGSYGIFGQRFDAMGRKVGVEFRVNSEYIGDQTKPAVAMNNQGDFVVTYTSSHGQDLGYFQELIGQRFNRRGEPVGVEFQINQASIPNLPTEASTQITANSAVVMDESGGFVVTWDTFVAQADGVIFNSVILARMFNPNGTARTDEFRVDHSNISSDAIGNTYADPEHRERQNAVDVIGASDIRRTARNPQIAMDGQGNFTIVWESWRDNDIDEDTDNQGDDPGQDPDDWPDSYGIYFHQYNANGTERTDFDYNANFVNTGSALSYDTNFTGSQVNPSVAIDIDGEIFVVWNGIGAEPDPLYSANPTLVGNFDATGVFTRRFTSSTGPNAAVYASQQQRVNYTDGGVQQFPTIATEPDGDRIVVWSGTGVGDQYGLFFRRYEEVIDTAGPLVTDLQLIDGAVLENGAQVIDEMQYVIVTFDEDLTRAGTNGVLNLNNWSLMKNGVKLTAGIKEIQFGLNQSSVMGLNSTASNKWEAVLLLDGNGVTSGTPVLTGGNYEIRVSNAIRDVAGNALGRTGYNIQGASDARTFYLVPPTGGENLVNTNDTTGDQIFLDPSGDPDTVPNSPRSIAGDADGDHVVVWTTVNATTSDIWAKIYRTEWTGTAANRVSTLTVVKEFQITTDVIANFAGVARDGDGDFIVTWSQNNGTTAEPDWDVYFQRFDANGAAIDLEPRMANIETEHAQRYSTVAMDIDGDFVVAWQSEDQDGSGYGVYAQAYSRGGEIVGGLNEIQVLTISESTTNASFRLEFDLDVEDGVDGPKTDIITYAGNLEDTAAQIEAAIANMGVLGLTVQVEVLDETQLAIEFTGEYGGRDVPPLVIHREPGGNGSLQLRVETEGISSEFQVNDTTDGDQLFASAAMDAQGNYIISWTSFGQDGDAPNESNIYAKRFTSSEILVGSATALSATTSRNNGAVAQPRVIASGDDHTDLIVADGTGYDGVVQVFAGGGSGTGSLLLSGNHILTAAHVVADDFGNALPASAVSVTFTLPTGLVSIPASEVFVHPAYNGDIFDGNDVAIIVLANPGPAEAERYDIYRGNNDLGQAFDRYGYGYTGIGPTGEDTTVDTTYILRGGENVYEALGSQLGINAGILVYDFDDGTAEHDALGLGYNIVDTGLPDDRETNSARGDSGGPAFINGLIAGITSGGFWSSLVADADINATPLDSSFGEISIDARISTYASWIDAITGGSSPEFLVNSVVGGDQKWSSVAMDLDGDYVITWTTHNQNGTGNGPGDGFIDQNAIAARRFNADNTAVGPEFQVNTYTAENQQHSQVAMDADGDFMIAWESFQEPLAAATSFGVYAQRFVATGKMADNYVGVNGRLGAEIHVNTTTEGDQRMPSVLLSHAGDAVIAWTGPGTNGTIDVFTQRYNVLADQAGPVVTDVLGLDSNTSVWSPILAGEAVETEVGKLMVIFGEDLNTQYSTSGPNSILNPNNWVLTRDGEVVTDAVVEVVFGFNAATGKYEALVTIDGDPETEGIQTLEDGQYVLTIRDNVMDRFGNRLDGNYDGTPGGDYVLTFTVLGAGSETRVNTDPDGKQVFMDETLPIAKTPNSPQSTASDADGDYGVVWTDLGHVTDEIQRITLGGSWGKFKLQYNGLVTADISFTGDIDATTAAIQAAFDGLGLQTQVVAIDDLTIEVRFIGAAANVNHPQLVAAAGATPNISGDVTVTTTVQGGDTVQGVFVKLYDVTWAIAADGERTSTLVERQPINPATGAVWAKNEICVTTNPTATYASIAMDADGDFVVTWSQNDGTAAAPDWNVYARRYDAMGNAGVTELQALKLSNIPTATGLTGVVKLEWNGLTTGDIALSIPNTTTGLSAAATAVQTALQALGANVVVTAEAAPSAETGKFNVSFGIRFQGTQSRSDQLAIAFASQTWTAGTALAEAVISRDGSAGEAFRVNSVTIDQQRYSTVAIDHDGDFVIAWQSEAQNGNGYEIYAQAYDRFGKALGVGDELQVLSFSASSAGSFRLFYRDTIDTEIGTNVITYNGDLVATAQQIQTELALLGLDVEVVAQEPADIEIRFRGADGGFDHRQLLLDVGEEDAETITGLTIQTQQQGKSGEFRVNENMEGDQVYASVAMDAVGNFVVTWTSYDFILNDGDASNIHARQYVWIDSPNTTDAEDVIVAGAEFLVNQTLVGEQRWSDVAMDKTGDFVITWTSVSEDPNNEDEEIGLTGRQDVFARRYYFNTTVGGGSPVDNVPVGNEFQVNSYTRGTQQHSSASMDADGDFIIAWESFQDLPGPGSDQPNSLGVYAQAYVRNALLGQVGGANGEWNEEFAVNGTKVGPQRLPSVALDDTGDAVFVWSGKGTVLGQEDDQGIFMRRDDQETDVAGPTVTDVLYLQEPQDAVDTLEVVLDGALVRYEVNKFVVVFGEDLNLIYDTLGAHSITNPEHWQILKNGAVLEDGITRIEFGLNKAYELGMATSPSGKYEAVLTFDADVTKPGKQALGNGTYVLTIDDTVVDPSGNALDGDVDGTPGINFQHQFIIRAGEQGGDDPVGGEDDVISGGHTHAETPGATAMDADGDYVVAWTATTIVNGQEVDRAYIRLYDKTGDPKGAAMAVTPSAAFPDFVGDQQRYVTTAMDADGDFIVTWTNYRDTDGNTANGYEQVDVYARRYNAVGKAGVDEVQSLRLSGISATAGLTGTIHLSWNGQTTDGIAINISANATTGVAEAAAAVEAALKTIGANVTVKAAAVASTTTPGTLVLTFSIQFVGTQAESNQPPVTFASQSWTVGAPLVEALNVRDGNSGAPFRVNNYTLADQKWSDVAMDADGDFVVTWSSFGQEDGGQGGFGYGVYARRYDRFGYAYGPEFQVNTTVAGDQQFASVAMGADGSFVVTWQSSQNGVGDDIIARVFNADGSSVTSPLTGEFTVNDTLAGNQRYPDIAMDLAGGSYVITWSSSQQTDDPSGYGVYAKRFDRLTLEELTVRYAYQGDPVDFGEGETIEIPIVVDQDFRITDVNVRLNISHQDPSDLFVSVVSPSGEEIFLFQQVPAAGDQDGFTLAGPNGQNFEWTFFDDEAAIPIANGLPPFDGAYQPLQALAGFDDNTTGGTWLLRIYDNDPATDPDVDINTETGAVTHTADGGRLWSWSLEFTRDPAASDEVLVNATTQGNQMFSSVAMDHVGNAIVAWSGYGNEPGQEDTSGYGVFVRRLTTTMVLLGTEERLNRTTDGMQWLPSVAMDGEGNFVTVWTGDTANGSTNVFQYLGIENRSVDGPLVTDVFIPTTVVSTSLLTPLLEGGVADAGLKQLVVAFGENLSVAQTTVNGVRSPAIESVLNPNNWALERNGEEVHGAIVSITFGLNPETGKYESRLTFDGNGLGAGQPGLLPGEYTLVVRDQIEDLRGNRLDGDFDSLPGTLPDGSGHGGYAFHFSVPEQADTLGTEMRVNQSIAPIQILSEPKGTGFAREVTTMSVAVDHDGDYVVVWTMYAQDSPFDSDVYFRLYDRNNNPITDETRVNNITSGVQGNATVAMDADGDFIVVWESEAADGTLDVYSQRFTSRGQRIAVDRTSRIITDPYRNVANASHVEALVNTTVVGQQYNPAVSMDSYGNYVVVWGVSGQNFGYLNNVIGQRFNFRGEAVGAEFQVNAVDLPGASGPGLSGSFLVNPSVTLGDDGNFVVAWDRALFALSGVVTDSDVLARVFDDQSNPLTDEIVVNADEIIGQDASHVTADGAAGGNDVERIARNPQVARDTAGNFIVVFESYLDNDYLITDTPDSYGIYYRRFDALGTPLTDEVQQANTVVSADEDAVLDETATQQFAFDQVNPTIAIDADGDFAIFWNGNGAQPDWFAPDDPTLVSDRDDAGVFGRWFHAGTDTVLSYPTTVQQRANETVAGVQQFPSLAMEPDGDAVLVWAGSGVGDRHGIFVRRYDQTADTAGPMATELRLADADRTLVGPGENVFGNPTSLLVVFDEKLNTDKTGAGNTPGLHSVENVNNWALVNGRGEEIQGAIRSVTFKLDAATGKWVAEITFNAAGGAAGALANGTYTLIARTAIHDLAGNELARTGYQPYGTGRRFDALGNELPVDPVTSPTGGFGFQFRVNNTIPGDAPWGDLDQVASEPTTTLGQDNLALVTYQEDSAVARNGLGEYVVVWVEYSEVVDSSLFPIDPNADPDAVLPVIPATPVLEANIMAQRFDAQCREVGDPILVNSLTTGDQLDPAVAIDDAGNFVVIWSGDGTALGDATGIFGQRFDGDGIRQGGQFRVNDYINSIQDEPAVAMNPNTGDFVVTWTSFGQDGSRDGVYARRYQANGLAYGAEFRVNTVTSGPQGTPDIAMNATGSFVIVWASEEQDASGWGVFGQRFAANGTKLGSEFRVNTQQNGDQIDPAVGMDRQGNFVVTWASRQDGSGMGVYAQRYNASGVKQGGEFRVNTTTVHDQFEPDIAVSDKGIFVIVWTSFNQDTPYDENLRDWGIYGRMYNANGTDYVDARVGANPIGEFRVNAQTEGDQHAASVAMDAEGHYIVSWSGMHHEITTLVTQDDGQGGQTEPVQTQRPLSAIYTRFIDPPANGSSDAAQAELVVPGTTGADVFEFYGGPTPATWIVKLNGETLLVSADVGTIRFDGKGGQDTVTFSGAGANDRTELWANSGTFTSDYYSVEVSNVEIITASGGVGNDTLILHDGAGDDLLVIRPQSATFTGTGLNLSTTGYETVQAKADGGGTDTVEVYDTTGNDAFIATPSYATMGSAAAGAAPYARVESFERVKGYSTAGTDKAYLYDSVGDDSFTAGPGFARLFGADFFSLANGFRYVYAYGDAGGRDVANMTGSDGVDTFDASPNVASYHGAGFYNRAENFEVIQATGQEGGTDTVILHGSDEDDTFIAGRNYGKLSGQGYEIRADFFHDVIAYAHGGYDVAQFIDSSGDDTFVGTSTSSRMYGSGYSNRAFGFDQVKAWAVAGGNNVATLHDAALNAHDYLEAEDGWAQLSNTDVGFAYWASGFQTVNAHANDQGDKKRVASELDFVLATTGTWTDE